MMSRRTALLLLAACIAVVGAPQAHATTKRTVGAFDLIFYNRNESDGESKGRQNWTTQQMDDVAASVAVWTSRLTNTPGRQVQFHLFWYSFSGNTLADSSGPSNGDGATSWTYVEHVWRDGVNYSGPWAGFDNRIRFDINAANYSWNFGSGTPSSSQIDFRSVVTHEVGHAVGYNISYASNDYWGACWGTPTDPYAFVGYNGLSQWDKRLIDNSGNRPAVQSTGAPGDFNEEANPVWFTGPNAVAYYGSNVPVFAPSTFQGGSSLAHLDESRISNALMSPYVTLGQMNRQPLRLEWEIMKDLGWSVLTTKTWTKGAGTLSWADAANWGPNGAPDATWDVTLTGAGLAGGDVLNLAGNQTVNLLSIDASTSFTVGGSSGTLTIAKGNLMRTAASAGTQTIARPVALGASAIWDVAGSGQLAVSGAVSGTGFALEKRGPGTLLLAGANTYTGATTVSAGTLQIASTGTINSTGGITVAGGAQAIFAGAPTLTGTIDVTGTFTAGAASRAGTFNLNAGGTANVTGGLNGTGAGAATLAAGSTFNATGATSMTGWTSATLNTNVNLNGGAIGATGTVSLGNGATLKAGNVTANGFQVASGAATINSLTGTSPTTSEVSVAAGQTLTVNSSIKNVASIGIGTGSTLTTSATVRSTNVTSALTIAGGAAPTGTLQLNDGLLAINYTSTNPINTVRAQIVSAYNAAAGGDWSGRGITSALLAGGSTTNSIGYAENGESAVWFDSGTPFGDYAGADSTTVLVRYTLIGDVNLDGIVDDSDISILSNNYGFANMSWADGDVYGYDGIVSDDDVGLQANNYGMLAGQLTGGISALAAVPEPATLALLALGAAAMITRRRRAGR
jgi:autotransporter-associated beta strand protein